MERPDATSGRDDALPPIRRQSRIIKVPSLAGTYHRRVPTFARDEGNPSGGPDVSESGIPGTSDCPGEKDDDGFPARSQTAGRGERGSIGGKKRMSNRSMRTARRKPVCLVICSRTGFQRPATTSTLPSLISKCQADSRICRSAVRTPFSNSGVHRAAADERREMHDEGFRVDRRHPLILHPSTLNPQLTTRNRTLPPRRREPRIPA